MAAKQTKRADSVEDEGARSFGVLLMQLDEGVLHEELSMAVVKIVRELRERAEMQAKSAKGSLAVTLKFEVGKNRADVTADFNVKMPSVPKGASTFFMTKGGNLSIDNPRQPDLPGLRDVSILDEPARDIPAPTERAAIDLIAGVSHLIALRRKERLLCRTNEPKLTLSPNSPASTASRAPWILPRATRTPARFF